MCLGEYFSSLLLFFLVLFFLIFLTMEQTDNSELPTIVLSEDWRGITDPSTRRKLQNRLNQREYRKRSLHLSEPMRTGSYGNPSFVLVGRVGRYQMRVYAHVPLCHFTCPVQEEETTDSGPGATVLLTIKANRSASAPE